MNHNISSELTLKLPVNKIFDNRVENIKILFEKIIFVIVDETKKDNIRNINVLMGTFEDPYMTFDAI